MQALPVPSPLYPRSPCGWQEVTSALSKPTANSRRCGPARLQPSCHNVFGEWLISRTDRELHSTKEQGSPCCKTLLWVACSQEAELWEAGLEERKEEAAAGPVHPWIQEGVRCKAYHSFGEMLLFVMCPKGHQRFAPGHLQLAHPACCQSCLRRKSTAEGSPSCLSEQGHCVRSKCRAGEGCWSRSHPQWTNSSMLLGILGCLTLFRGAEHACSPAGQQVMEALSFPGSIPLPPFSSRCG